MTAIRRVSLVDQIYQRLRSEIIFLKRPLGSKLNMDELCSSYGISSTPIREAMNRLQQERLIVYRNNVGASVLSLTGHDITEIQQVARVLHFEAIRLAMLTGDRKKIVEQLKVCLDNYCSAQTVVDEVMAVCAFYGVFYHHCGNARLDDSMLAIQGQQLLLRNLYFSQFAQRGHDFRCYERVLHLVEENRTDDIFAALQENIDYMTETLVGAVPN